MSIARKIFALAAVFGFAVVGMGAYGLSQMDRLGETVQSMSDQSMTLTEISGTLHRIATGQLRQQIEFERALRAATGRGHGELQEAAYVKARKRFEQLQYQVSHSIEVGEAEVQTALLRPLNAAERTKIEDLHTRLLEISAQQVDFSERVGSTFALIDDGAVSAAVAEATDVGAGAVSFDFELSGLIADVRARTGEIITTTQRRLAGGRAGLLVLMGFVSVFSLIAWSLMARSILSPLRQLENFAEVVAEGRDEVEWPVARQDETGRAFESIRSMVGSIETANARARRAAKDLDGALSRIADQNRRLHALERELAELRRNGVGSAGPREIVGPQRRSDT